MYKVEAYSASNKPEVFIRRMNRMGSGTNAFTFTTAEKNHNALIIRMLNVSILNIIDHILRN
jgi:hypothetical protein